MKQKEIQRLASLYRRELLERRTFAEKVFENKLRQLKIRFIPQKCFYAKGFFCIVDVYLPRPCRLCIEIDGGYHLTDTQKRKDLLKDSYLVLTRNFTVLRVTNEAAVSMTAGEIKSLIKQKISERNDSRTTQIHRKVRSLIHPV